MDMVSVLLGLILIGIVVVAFLQLRKKDDGHFHVSDRVDNLNKQMVDTLMTMQKQMEERLKVTSEQTMQGSKHLGDRMDNAAKAVQSVMIEMAKLKEDSKKIFDVGKDIASLQDLLKAPKLRGNLGEFFLGDLLAQIFPAEHFSMQYRFKDGLTVDAVLMLKDDILVPVDSKFPLENFLTMIQFQKEQNDGEALKARKLFITQVKKHIDDIASKYIRPEEHTLDFALMYIPAENVYYETIIRDDENLVTYAHKKKVFPVSPNSFYIYLQAILMGLRGLQIEKETKNILAGLSKMSQDFGKFGEDFKLIGTHLGRAQGSYENSEKRLEKFQDSVGNLLKGRDGGEDSASKLDV